MDSPAKSLKTMTYAVTARAARITLNALPGNCVTSGTDRVLCSDLLVISDDAKIG